MMKSLLEPLFNGSVVLDSDEAQLFFDNYKKMKSEGSYMTAGHFSLNDNNIRVLLAGTVIYSTSSV